jgi:hypothetical protein
MAGGGASLWAGPEDDPDNAETHHGLSVALRQQDLVEQGIEHALLAVG